DDGRGVRIGHRVFRHLRTQIADVLRNRPRIDTALENDLVRHPRVHRDRDTIPHLNLFAKVLGEGRDVVRLSELGWVHVVETGDHIAATPGQARVGGDGDVELREVGRRTRAVVNEGEL